MSIFLSPEGVIMMLAASLLDLVGFLLFILDFVGIGIPLSFIPDIIGILIIGGWIFLRTGRMGVTKEAAKISQKVSVKLGLTTLGELIPFFGDLAPCWVLLVFNVLKEIERSIS